MDRRTLNRLFAVSLASFALAACGGGDDDEPTVSTPPTPQQPPAPPPPPPPASTLPAQLPTTFQWFSPTSLAGAVQLVRSGATGSAEGVTYTFASDSAGRILLSGGSVTATMSRIADQGAVLQLCRIQGNAGDLAVLVDAALPAPTAADLNGKTFDEARCGSASSDFAASGSFYVVTGGTATFFESATTPAAGDEQVTVLLSTAGSAKYQAEIGVLRWRAFRRPDGSIVIVETASGGSLAPSAGGEPAGVSLYLQRP